MVGVKLLNISNINHDVLISIKLKYILLNFIITDEYKLFVGAASWKLSNPIATRTGNWTFTKYKKNSRISPLQFYLTSKHILF